MGFKIAKCGKAYPRVNLSRIYTKCGRTYPRADLPKIYKVEGDLPWKTYPGTPTLELTRPTLETYPRVDKTYPEAGRTYPEHTPLRHLKDIPRTPYMPPETLLPPYTVSTTAPKK
jgi:hypothetical protein